MRRRTSLEAIALACMYGPATGQTNGPSLRLLATAGSVAQIAAGGPTGILAVGERGTLYTLDSKGGEAMPLAEGIDAGTPLAVDPGRIAARLDSGALWVWDAGGIGQSTAQLLAPAAGLLLVPQAVIGVSADEEQRRVIRLEPSRMGVWSPAARSRIEVLPDARPRLADLDGDGNNGHVVVLGEPNATRYAHGVLGDAVEAVRVCVLERHSLRLQRELVLAAPYVFEDIAPRRVRLAQRDGLLTVRSGPQGAQLVLLDADPANTSSLRMVASGPALGTALRWLSPSTNGDRWMAVHTPHIGGVLHAYRQDGQRLVPTRVLGGITNHVIGSRHLDLACWLGPRLLIPDQRRERLVLLDANADWQPAQTWHLPSRLVASTRLGSSNEVALLLEDGSVAVVRVPG